MSRYERRVASNLPYIDTKKVFFGRGNYDVHIVGSDSQITVYTPSGSIKVTNEGVVRIEGQIGVNLFGDTTIENDLTLNSSLFVSNDISLNDGVLYLNKTDNKLVTPNEGAYASSSITEGDLLVGTFKPSAATGYIKIKIGDNVGVIPMYSASRLA